MQSNDLIQRYLIGDCTEEEVAELERRLRADERLQDAFLREAEIDAHLRQEAQLGGDQTERIAQARKQPRAIWKWVSGISTLAATILLAVVLLNFPPQKTAMAFPSLGSVEVQLPLADSIWLAACTANRTMLDGELRNGVSVDAKLDDELTALHVAALFGQTEATRWLLAENADVSIADSEGNTALHMAAFLGNTTVVRQLLDSGADPMLRNELGFNSIDHAASPWNDEQEEYLIALSETLQTEFDLKQIRKNRHVILKLLLNATSTDEATAPDISIFDAVLVGNLRAVKEHISAGTDLNQKEGFGGSTPLMLAAIFGKTEIAKLLIEANVDLDLQNDSGGTALHQACFFCRPNILEMLIEAGADLNKTNGRDLTPLDSATMELDANLVSAYQAVYESLGLEFELDKIATKRKEIVKLLRQKLGRDSAKEPTAQQASPMTAFEYAKLVEPDLGVPPKIALDECIEIPLYTDGVQKHGVFNNDAIDNPTRLGKESTASGSVIQRYEGKTADGKPLPDVVWVVFGRNENQDGNHRRFIGSVQMIGYDRATGDTAFFETSATAGRDLNPWITQDEKTLRMRGEIPWIDEPEQFNKVFVTPAAVKTQCNSCHQADPFITSPFVNAAKIPGTDESVVPFLDADSPYYVIGGEDWDMRTIHLEGNACLECHRVGMKTIELFNDAGWDVHKRMPPDAPGSLKDDYRALLDVWIKGPENVDGAEWVIPPARGKDRQIVGDDYPHRKSKDHK
jgi:ankyrin repeat protein